MIDGPIATEPLCIWPWVQLNPHLAEPLWNSDPFQLNHFTIQSHSTEPFFWRKNLPLGLNLFWYRVSSLNKKKLKEINEKKYSICYTYYINKLNWIVIEKNHLDLFESFKVFLTCSALESMTPSWTSTASSPTPCYSSWKIHLTDSWSRA